MSISTPPRSVQTIAARNNSCLGVFQQLWKATISFLMSGCKSIRMEKLGYKWTDFHEILYLNIFRKYVEEIQVSLKSDKNNWHFT